MKCFTKHTARLWTELAASAFSYKSLLSRLTVFLLLLMLSQETWAQARVTNVAFTQLNRYGGREHRQLVFPNSSLGRITLSVIPDRKETYYLNVFAKTNKGAEAWLLQNLSFNPSANGTYYNSTFPGGGTTLPGGGITPDTLTPSIAVDCIATSIDFKLLGIEPGKSVDQVVYAVSMTKEILLPKKGIAGRAARYLPISERIAANQFPSAAAAFTAPLRLTYNTVTVDKADFRNEVSGAYNENTDMGGFYNDGPVVDTVRAKKDRDIPGGLDEGENDCVPGSFARSIAWLGKQHGFANGRSLKDIFDTLKARMSNCALDFDCQFKAKSDYLKELTNNKGVTDSTWDSQNPSGIISGNPDCDVEIGMGPAPGGDIGHFITVVSITCGTNGCCTIKYRDDEDQYNNGSDNCVKTTTICGDSITYGGTTRKVQVIVTECVSSTSRIADGKAALAESIQLLPNVPNPFDNTTTLRIQVQEASLAGPAIITIRNDRGVELQKIKVNLQKGLNQVRYQPGRDVKGILYSTLEVGGKVAGTQKMFVQ